MAKTKPCTTVFSNGSEYMWFIENNCDQCTRFRNGKCAVYNKLEMARWDETLFPYDMLLDYEDNVAGKICVRFTDEPQKRHRRECVGQIGMDI